jgi:hypothetical protein
MKCIIVAKILNSIQRDRIELKEVESALSNAKDGMGIICYTAGITIEGFHVPAYSRTKDGAIMSPI